MIDAFMVIVAAGILEIFAAIGVVYLLILACKWARDYWRRGRAAIETTVDEHADQAAAIVAECTWCDPKVRDGLCSCDVSCSRYLCKGPVPLGTWNDHDIEVIEGRRPL